MSRPASKMDRLPGTCASPQINLSCYSDVLVISFLGKAKDFPGSLWGPGPGTPLPHGILAFIINVKVEKRNTLAREMQRDVDQ